MKHDKVRNSHEGDGGRPERGNSNQEVGSHGYDYKTPDETTRPKYYGGDHRPGKMSGRMK